MFGSVAPILEKEEDDSLFGDASRVSKCFLKLSKLKCSWGLALSLRNFRNYGVDTESTLK